MLTPFKSLNIHDDCANIGVSLPNITGGALPNDPVYIIIVSAWERLLEGYSAGSVEM